MTFWLMALFGVFFASIMTFKFKMTLTRMMVVDEQMRSEVTAKYGKNTCDFMLGFVALYDVFRPKFSLSWLITRPSYSRENSVIFYVIMMASCLLMIFSLIPSIYLIPLVIVFCVTEYISYWRDTFYFTMTGPEFKKKYEELYNETKPTIQLG